MAIVIHLNHYDNFNTYLLTIKILTVKNNSNCCQFHVNLTSC